MHNWVVVFLLLSEVSYVKSRMSVVSGILVPKGDNERAAKHLLGSYEECEQNGGQMEGFTENRKLTIVENCSYYRQPNSTKFINEFDLVFKEVNISFTGCEGVVLGVTLFCEKVKIILNCSDDGRIDRREKSLGSSINDQILNVLIYAHKLLHLPRPPYMKNMIYNRTKNGFTRYRFMSDDIEQKEKSKRENERFWEKMGILLIVLTVLTCLIIVVSKCVRCFCGKNTPGTKTQPTTLNDCDIIPETSLASCYIINPYEAAGSEATSNSASPAYGWKSNLIQK